MEHKDIGPNVDGSNPNIRLAKPGDADLLLPILEQWVKDRVTGEILTDEIKNVHRLIEASTSGDTDRSYVVAEDHEGKILGVMGITTPDETMKSFAVTSNPKEIINAYIDQDQKGKGVGSTLFENLEQMAQKSGITELIVNSGPRYKDSGWGFWNKIFGEPIAIQKDLYGPGGDATVWSKRILA